jgi:hypothetical protein
MARPANGLTFSPGPARPVLILTIRFAMNILMPRAENAAIRLERCGARHDHLLQEIAREFQF